MSQKKSMFEYITDNARFENKNKCADYTPPFVSYVPIGVTPKNIDVDTDLRGITRRLSKCTEDKYNDKYNEKNNIKDNEEKKAECSKEWKVRPYGYF